MVALDGRIVVLGLRIAQAVFTIIVLGLTAYGEKDGHYTLEGIS